MTKDELSTDRTDTWIPQIVARNSRSEITTRFRLIHSADARTCGSSTELVRERTGAVDTACSLSEPPATLRAAKNKTTRTADCANSRHMARVWPPTSSEERKRLMLSIPPTPDAASTCTNPHVDGCPGCVANVEPPEHVERRPDGCAAYYRCNDCGHEWATSWGCR